jgi:hypothetical protein
MVTAVNCRVLQIGFAKKKGYTSRNRNRLGRKLYVICGLQVDTIDGSHAEGAN